MRPSREDDLINQYYSLRNMQRLNTQTSQPYTPPVNTNPIPNTQVPNTPVLQPYTLANMQIPNTPPVNTNLIPNTQVPNTPTLQPYTLPNMQVPNTPPVNVTRPFIPTPSNMGIPINPSRPFIPTPSNMGLTVNPPRPFISNSNVTIPINITSNVPTIPVFNQPPATNITSNVPAIPIFTQSNTINPIPNSPINIPIYTQPNITTPNITTPNIPVPNLGSNIPIQNLGLYTQNIPSISNAQLERLVKNKIPKRFNTARFVNRDAMGGSDINLISLVDNPLNEGIPLDQFKQGLLNHQGVGILTGVDLSMGEYLYYHASRLFIRQLINSFGLVNLQDWDVIYDLLFYFSIVAGGTLIDYTNPELAYISGLTKQQLFNILGSRYGGQQDKTSMLFTLLTGTKISRVNTFTDRNYQIVKNYPAAGAWNLYQTRITDVSNVVNGRLPVYIALACIIRKITDDIIISADVQNIDTLINQYQVVLPPQDAVRTPAEKITAFIKQIKLYDRVLSRLAGTQAPEKYYLLKARPGPDRRDYLKKYTTRELLNAYGPVDGWDSRSNLIATIDSIAEAGARWYLTHTTCKNDDAQTIDLEQRIDINKDNPNDPTVSYGFPDFYNCYQVSELDANFGMQHESTTGEGDVFKFGNPDYDQSLRGTINPASGTIYTDQFELTSMRSLLRILRNYRPQLAIINSLIAKINTGIEFNNDEGRRLRQLGNTYRGFNENQKDLVKLVMAWFFMFAMWMRFWKGPGYTWPVETIRAENTARWEAAQRVDDIDDREEHVFIQYNVLSKLKERYERDPAIREWIESLPRVTYNFQNGRLTISGQGDTIFNLVDTCASGQYCMGLGGDAFLQNSYIDITRILDEQDINTFIAQQLPQLLELERQVVRDQLAAIRNPTANEDVIRRVRVLRNRERELSQPLRPQNAFVPENVGSSIHTNVVER